MGFGLFFSLNNKEKETCLESDNLVKAIMTLSLFTSDSRMS